MPHVSKKQLQRGTFEKIYQRLIKTLWSARSQKEFGYLLTDILTDTEEVMLAKRLSILFLLHEGVSQYRIKKVLQVSSRTISYLEERLENGFYKHLESRFKKHTEKKEMWDLIEIIVRAGMPEYGKGRWKGLRF